MKFYMIFMALLVSVSLSLTPLSTVYAQEEDEVALDVGEDLEPLEAERFDDEIEEIDFEDIDESEFEDIDGGGEEISDDLGGDGEVDDSLQDPLEVGDDVDGDLGDEDLTADIGDEEVIEDGEGGEEIPDDVIGDVGDETGDETADEEAIGEQPGEDITADAISADIPEDPVNEETAIDLGGEGEVVSDPILDDEPDQGFESRLHQIFEEYYKTPISNEEWAQIVGNKKKETYTVAEGDSLWAISELFFGDGNYWPKVWSFNSAITNPHIIEINDRIGFFPGDEENPPKVVIEQAPPEEEDLELELEDQETEEVVYEDEGPLEDEELYNEAGEVLDIPEPTRSFVPLLRTIPPSLPEERPKFFEGFDASGFAVSDRRFSRSEVAEMKLTSFLAEEEPEPIGEISELPGGKGTAQLYEPVYIQVDSGASGDIVSAYKVVEKGADNRELEFKDGFVVQYLGEIELQDIVNEDLNLYRGLVVSLIGRVGPGALITQGRIPSVNISNQGETVSTQANVIGGQFDSDRQVLGVGSVVYLDAGQAEGIEPESIVGIVANERLRNSQTKITTNNREIARVKIAKVEENLSTGVVVYASENVTTGDFVGLARSSNFSRDSDIDGDGEDDLDFGGDIGDEDIEDDLNDAFDDDFADEEEDLDGDDFGEDDFGDDDEGEDSEGDFADSDEDLEDELEDELGDDEDLADDSEDLDEGDLEDELGDEEDIADDESGDEGEEDFEDDDGLADELAEDLEDEDLEDEDLEADADDDEDLTL